MTPLRASLAVALLLVGCSGKAPLPDDKVPSSAFPEAARPVAPIISSRWSTEEARDRLSEAETVMTDAGVAPGMTVADIGAGEGYYTIHLAQRVGTEGRVLAQDIIPEVRDRLAERVTREALDNVSVKLGKPSAPGLPPASFDRIFLVHMYHEIARPYEFLWRLRPALREGGRIVVVDAERPTAQHGTPAALLDCEMAAVGLSLVERKPMPQVDGYLALFEAKGARPAPDAIRVCG